MPFFTDQLGRTFFLPLAPRRIISLVPSQTELLYALGLDETVVGITKFCVRPEAWFHSKSRVGGTKAVDPTRVDALQPDLIIANKEENDRPQVEALAARYPVWISDIKTLEDALDMIRNVGELTGKGPEALALAEAVANGFRQMLPPSSPIPAAYFIWRNPYMAAGGDTFINDMLRYCGYANIFSGQDRYPAVDLSSFSGHDKLHILLSSEPYPFRQRHLDEIKEILPNATIRLVDGEFFSWYGSRLLEAPAYFRQLSDI
ncbi:MAG TPA: helical backbone metal receptor [Puia sp.]|jgi:ABC-type Fe3+-hydroxamate transport system substrate-binding protein|nr:helical backbone metal receptor [Puia sp.]